MSRPAHSQRRREHDGMLGRVGGTSAANQASKCGNAGPSKSKIVLGRKTIKKRMRAKLLALKIRVAPHAGLPGGIEV
jgi:hypothetical protein